MIKDYTIKSELGQGGMATVYLAEDKKFLTNFAVKVLAKEFSHNENIRKRFLAEAKNMFKMNHPNIVKVTDLIEEGDTVAFVMEYIEGETLKEYLERKGKLNDDEIKNLFTQMLEAVGYVHEQGLIHRDIKPSNFMISPNGQVKLLDFGIAKNTNATSAEYTQTGTGMQMGTPMYMSPEQITETKSITAQSDIYSLGVVLWQMAMGQKPYDLKSISNFQLQNKIVNDKLSLTNTSFDLIIIIATEKQLNNRFKNCNEIKSKLDNLQHQNFENSKGYSIQNSEKTIIENNNDNTVLKTQNNNYTSKSNNHTSNTFPPSKKKNNLKLVYIISGIVLLIILCVIIVSKILSHMKESGGPLPPAVDTTKVVKPNFVDTIGEAIPSIGNSIIYTVYNGEHYNEEEEKNKYYAVPIVVYNEGKYIDPPTCDNWNSDQNALDQCKRSKELLLPSVQPGSMLFEIENGKQTNKINVMDTKDFGFSDWSRSSGQISYKPNSSLLTDNYKIGTNRLATINNMHVTEQDNRLRLLGKVDIDGDGKPELIYEFQDEEGKSYNIYSYLNGKWMLVYEEGGYQGY